jgi:hypothetical protein
VFLIITYFYSTVELEKSSSVWKGGQRGEEGGGGGRREK